MTVVRQTVPEEGVVLAGDGLHSGQAVEVRILPGERGIWLRHGGEAVEAVPENVSDTARCTKLGGISTVEHLMAAFAGLGITDADVELTYPELPALDGSSKPYVEALRAAGPLKSLGEVEAPGLFSRVFLHEGDAKLAVSAGSGEWRYEFSCAGRWPDFQAFETLDLSADFEEGIAPARTFGFESELPDIRAAGLAKGLDLDKALLIGESGYANAPRFPDEPARHKLLDAIGDLYLSGVPVRMLNVVAERTGHRMNVLAAQRLREAAKG